MRACAPLTSFRLFGNTLRMATEFRALRRYEGFAEDVRARLAP